MDSVSKLRFFSEQGRALFAIDFKQKSTSLVLCSVLGLFYLILESKFLAGRIRNHYLCSEASVKMSLHENNFNAFRHGFASVLMYCGFGK